jgi:hypothetical protein
VCLGERYEFGLAFGLGWFRDNWAFGKVVAVCGVMGLTAYVNRQICLRSGSGLVGKFKLEISLNKKLSSFSKRTKFI